MVGGIVIGLSRGPENTLVNVKDAKSENSSGDECAVRCIEKRLSDGSPVQIQVGDSIWWQGGKCMWTPKANRKPAGSGQKCGKDFDIMIPKVGYSH